MDEPENIPTTRNI